MRRYRLAHSGDRSMFLDETGWFAAYEDCQALLLECINELTPPGVGEVGDPWTSITTEDYDRMHKLAGKLRALLSPTTQPADKAGEIGG